MTDLDTMKSMLDRADIEYEVEPSEREVKYDWNAERCWVCVEKEPVLRLTIEGGYVGFYSAFLFTPDGTLVDHGAYEG